MNSLEEGIDYDTYQSHSALPKAVPTVTQTFQSGSTSQTAVRSHNQDDYHAIWSSWKQGIPQNKGEQRDIVVARMYDALERKSDFLDLGKLNLSSLPDMIPEQIQEFNLAKNRIRVYEQRVVPG